MGNLPNDVMDSQHVRDELTHQIAAARNEIDEWSLRMRAELQRLHESLSSVFTQLHVNTNVPSSHTLHHTPIRATGPPSGVRPHPPLPPPPAHLSRAQTPVMSRPRAALGTTIPTDHPYARTPPLMMRPPQFPPHGALPAPSHPAARTPPPRRAPHPLEAATQSTFRQADDESWRDLNSRISDQISTENRSVVGPPTPAVPPTPERNPVEEIPTASPPCVGKRRARTLLPALDTTALETIFAPMSAESPKQQDTTPNPFSLLHTTASEDSNLQAGLSPETARIDLDREASGDLNRYQTRVEPPGGKNGEHKTDRTSGEVRSTAVRSETAIAPLNDSAPASSPSSASPPAQETPPVPIPTTTPRYRFLPHLRLEYANHRPLIVHSGASLHENPSNENPSEHDTGECGVATHSGCHVLVEFKRARVLQHTATGWFPPGRYVVVAGDRGVDVGVVIVTWQTTESAVVATAVPGASIGQWVGLGSGRVQREATAEEVRQVLGPQQEREREAVAVATHVAKEMGLGMEIVDAEFQFDLKKLTIFYRSATRLDFRELVRNLYRTFHARIWMESVESNVE